MLGAASYCAGLSHPGASTHLGERAETPHEWIGSSEDGERGSDPPNSYAGDPAEEGRPDRDPVPKRDGMMAFLENTAKPLEPDRSG